MKRCCDCQREISKGHTRCKSCAVKGFHNPHYGSFGAKHPFFGRHHTKEHKQKMSDLKKFKARDYFYGEGNPNWKGGVISITEIIRSMIKYKVWQEYIFNRDNKTCQTCGSKENIETHHKIPMRALVNQILSKYPNILKDRPRLIKRLQEYKPLWDLENGECLCEKCHLLSRAKRNAV